MDKNKKIIVGIQEARETHERWLNQAHLLLDREYIQMVEAPTACTECDFSLLFSIDEYSLNESFNFDEIKLLHDEFHTAYEILYEEAQQEYYSKNNDVLKNLFSNLEIKSVFFMNKLDEIKKVFENTCDDLSTENHNKTSNETQDSNKFNEELIKSHPEQFELQKQLKKQNLEQLQQEQKLTQQELDYLEERQGLTSQSLEQIVQYQQLNKKEVYQQKSDQEKLEDDNSIAQELRQQELIKIKQHLLLMQDELEMLKLLDPKIGELVVEEMKQEQKVLDDFEQQQYALKEDLIKLDLQYRQWQSELESLKKQQSLIEDDMAAVIEEQQEKQSILDNANNEKELKLLALEQSANQEDSIKGGRIKQKESALKELKELEQERASKEDELVRLELQSENLIKEKDKITTLKLQQSEQLDEQYQTKKSMVDRLEQDRMEKQIELRELNHKEQAVEQSLEQMRQLERQQLTLDSLEKLDQLRMDKEKELVHA